MDTCRRAIIGLTLLTLLTAPARVEAITATLLFPSAGGTQYGGGFQVAWIIVGTDVNATCKYDSSNVAYASMGHTFYNTGGWTYHVQRFATAPGTYTYYYACQDDSALTTTPTASVTYSVDGTYPGTVAADLTAVALSATSVKISFSDPTNGSTTTAYKIYRNGSLVHTDSQAPYYVDSGLTADTVYTYTASVSLSGVEQTQSPGYPVRTLPSGTAFSVVSSVPKLEDFESGNTVIDSGSSNDWTHYLWNNYPYSTLSGTAYSDAAIATPTISLARDGTHAFNAHMTGFIPSGYSSAAPMYFTMYPFTPDDVRHFAREYLKTGTWAFNTYNRLRFWIKTPSTWKAATGGSENIQVGTYVRSSHGDSGGAGAEESGEGGNHFYHFFNVPHTDSWYQVIVDTHPSHQRGGPGAMEWTDHAHFSGEPSWTYFDALSRWYIDTTVSSANSGLSFPNDFYIDDIEFFSEDDSTSDVDHIYSINGGFDVTSGTVYVGWSHPKNDGSTKAQVVYAFSDLHALGFANGTVFPGTSGGLTPQGDVYACELLSTNAIDVSGHKTIYIGIQQAGDTGFRQIAIPLPPKAPTSVRVGR